MLKAFESQTRVCLFECRQISGQFVSTREGRVGLYFHGHFKFKMLGFYACHLPMGGNIMQHNSKR